MSYNSFGKMEAREVGEKKRCGKEAVFSSFVGGN